MTIGLFLTSFALGLRHGVDWDHIAAIADLNSAVDDRRRGFLLSLCYALGHAIVVFVLGTILILLGATIPESLDVWMGRIVGATLVGLGVLVLVDLRRAGGEVRLRSRWMLVLEGTFAGVRRVRRHRGRRRIAVEHSHDHEHDGDLDHGGVPAHDHAHQVGSELVGVPTPVAHGARSHDRPHRHRHPHVHHLELPLEGSSSGGGVATGIGMIHGVGIESPTQIAIFVASTSVVGAAGGLALLGAWVIGLIVANAGLAIAAGTGVLRAGAGTKTFRVIAVIIAAASIGLGLRYLLAG